MSGNSKLTELGLRDYLDGTKGLHNGNGYAEFLEYVWKRRRVNKAGLARVFNVSRPVVYRWLKHYDELEQKKSDTSQASSTPKWA